MKRKERIWKKVLAGFLSAGMLLGSLLPVAVSAEGTVVYVSAEGTDKNFGTETAPVKSIEKALELVSENGTIQIMDQAESDQLGNDEPLCITKNITITGGEISLNRAGIVLGADVAFRNVSVTFKNPVRNAIIANGYSLTLENVKKGTGGKYPIHLFGGSVTGYMDGNNQPGELPKAGEEGQIQIFGKDNELGDFFGGSLSEYGENNEWSGSASITIGKGSGGVIGNFYAGGATEPRGQGDGSGMNPDSKKYKVTGTVTMNISGVVPAYIDGGTGGTTDAKIVFEEEKNIIDTVSFANIGSLSVVSGTLKPVTLNDNLNVTIGLGGELDLSNVITDDNIFNIKDFNGGGTLAMDKKDRIAITGEITGSTVFQTTDSRPVNKSTSGIVEYAYEYIDVTKGSGDGVFTFVPYAVQNEVTFGKIEEDGKVSWKTSQEPDNRVKPLSFYFPITSSAMLMEEIETYPVLTVPVECTLAEDQMFFYVPLEIAVKKDGGEPVYAGVNEEGNYYIPELGFADIAVGYDEEGNDCLDFTFAHNTFQSGVYDIEVSVMLADNTIVTRNVTFYANRYEKLAGYTLSLNGNIGVNFYLELSKEILADKEAYMQFTLPDGSIEKHPVGEAVTNNTMDPEKIYYVFSCQVASYEMTKDIQAQILDGSGNGGRRYSYKIRDYAEYMIEHPEDYSENDRDFAKAMLNYGTCSQEYFQVAVSEPANKNLEESDRKIPAVTAAELEKYKSYATTNGLGTFAGYSLTLKSETTLKAYFQPAEGVDIKNITFMADGQEVEPLFSNGYYILSVKNIKAWNLDKTYEFKVIGAGEDEELSFTASALSYGYSVLNKGNSDYSEELLQLMRALRVYQEKAEVYSPENKKI